MTDRTCPLGEDCDLTVAWMAGRGDAEKTIAALRARAEAAEGELARLRHAIHEASDPDFLYGTMDNVASVNTPLMDCA
jgi:uncharacterized protein YfcZ (UPF0381/DUF406 family)